MPKYNYLSECKDLQHHRDQLKLFGRGNIQAILGICFDWNVVYWIEKPGCIVTHPSIFSVTSNLSYLLLKKHQGPFSKQKLCPFLRRWPENAGTAEKEWALHLTNSFCTLEGFECEMIVHLWNDFSELKRNRIESKIQVQCQNLQFHQCSIIGSYRLRRLIRSDNVASLVVFDLFSLAGWLWSLPHGRLLHRFVIPTHCASSTLLQCGFLIVSGKWLPAALQHGIPQIQVYYIHMQTETAFQLCTYLFLWWATSQK